MSQTIFLFIFDSPTQIIFVVAIIFLLFGSTRLPQLAKSIGQSQKAFKDGLREGEEAERLEQQKREIAAANASASPAAAVTAAPEVATMSDEELLAEMRRRAENKQEGR